MALLPCPPGKGCSTDFTGTLWCGCILPGCSIPKPVWCPAPPETCRDVILQWAESQEADQRFRYGRLLFFGYQGHYDVLACFVAQSGSVGCLKYNWVF